MKTLSPHEHLLIEVKQFIQGLHVGNKDEAESAGRLLSQAIKERVADIGNILAAIADGLITKRVRRTTKGAHHALLVAVIGLVGDPQVDSRAVAEGAELLGMEARHLWARDRNRAGRVMLRVSGRDFKDKHERKMLLSGMGMLLPDIGDRCVQGSVFEHLAELASDRREPPYLREVAIDQIILFGGGLPAPLFRKRVELIRRLSHYSGISSYFRIQDYLTLTGN